MRYVLLAAVVAVGVGAAVFVLRRRTPAPDRAAVAARWRATLVRLTHDEGAADRLAEAERRRDPRADMATCYRRAVARLERDRAR